MVLFICPNKHSGNFLLLMRGLGEDARVIAARQCPDCGATMRHVATWETLTAHDVSLHDTQEMPAIRIESQVQG